MKHLSLLNPENASEDEVQSYSTREAARAIVLDHEGKIALLHVAKDKYYKLPGGGIKKGEDRTLGLLRECKEEIGCDIEIIEEIGLIVEYRKMYHLKQTSYCYLAKLKGEEGRPAFTAKELAKGFEPLWLSYDDAYRALTECTPREKEGELYIVPRDIIFLEEAKQYLADLSH